MDEIVQVAGSVRPYTTKQMGDACEMLIAAELTLAGVPAMKAPDFWPGYDVIAVSYTHLTLPTILLV